MNSAEKVDSGFPGLDQILDHIRIGDNVVWKCDNIEDYQHFATPYVRTAIAAGRDMVYMRFGQHQPVVEASPKVTTYTLDPRNGFESFTKEIHRIVTSHGRGAFYVFDCLSDLLSAWATDQMIGNFFRVTCPYLFDLDTVAYFALIRGRHSHRTIARIRETTQLLLDLYNHQGDLYIHPTKVWRRHSPTMFLPHKISADSFAPVADSYQATQLLRNISLSTTDNARRQLDHWHHLFLDAEDLSHHSEQQEEQQQMIRHICRHLIGREERILGLARNYFDLPDLLEIKSRMIGTGFIGGKSVGMLLARKILLQDQTADWQKYLEQHDSYFVGSNVYYSYIVHNGWWQLFMEQKTDAGYFDAAKELRDKMLTGTFPDQVRQGFQQMLDYYGQYPIIVRSSSLLEDGFGNAFAGKYDSFFCANQGSPEERCEQLEDAVRRIFASTMSEDALTYRLQRGLNNQEEQMALLVQRVSGRYHDQYYFPDLAGVGVSFNTFVWDKEMDPQAGMLRLVFGLGTRAVDRVEGDYPRILALDAPLKQPHKGFEDTRKFSQRDVDLINVTANTWETVPLNKLLQEVKNIPIERFAIRDRETSQLMEQRSGKRQDFWLLTFEPLLAKTDFTALMQNMLKCLEKSYQYPVDIEFTVNFTSTGELKINPVQCRPLQTKGQNQRIDIPAEIPESSLLLKQEGNFMGGNIAQPLSTLIWIEPQEYVQLPLSDKYELARLVGRLNKRIGDKRENPTLLCGPGRWGSSTPSLGVPITFSEISNMAALAEVAFSSGDLMPELSFGSHFFQDLVETDTFYFALFPDHPNVHFDKSWLDQLPNALEGMMPASSRFKKVIKIYSFPHQGLTLMADVVSQRLVCMR